MHDPMVVVFHVKMPWLHTWPNWRDHPRWGVRRRRYSPSAEPSRYANKPMLHPWRPGAWTVHWRGRQVKWATLVTLWHVEPRGHDSGTICKGMGGSDLTWHNVVWAVHHWRHLEPHVEPYLRLKRWLTCRCAECGFRFFWRQSRHGDMSSDDTYHDTCISLRQLRGQVDDLMAVLVDDADRIQKWRVGSLIESRQKAKVPSGGEVDGT